MADLLVLPAWKWKSARDAVAALWSLYLREASDRALADLALCELVCAGEAEMERSFPELLAEPKSGAWALLVEPKDGSARWIRAELPVLPASTSNQEEDELELALSARNALLESAVHEAVARDGYMTRRRWLEQEAALTPAAKAQLAGKLNWDSEFEVAHAELVPAFVLLRAGSRRRRAARRLLADAALARWSDSAPDGALWKRTIGCSGGPCGTGYIPPLSRKFLEFYTEVR